MKLLNKILENINRDQINNPVNFSLIDKKDFENDVNNKILLDMKSELESKFDKFNTILRYAKNEHHLLTYLKHMCTELGLRLVSTRSSKKNNEKMIYSTNYSIVCDK